MPVRDRQACASCGVSCDAAGRLSMTRGRRAPACRDVTLKVDERRLSRSEAIRVLPRDGEAREILARENLMGKRRNQHPQQLQDNQDSIFAGNPFLDDLLAWRHSPEGEQFAAFSDVLCDVMEQVQLDARQRLFIWPDGERLDLDQSVARIHQQYPDWRHDWIEEYLIDWIEMDYAPEHYSTAQLEELDRLTERWVADHLRKAKTAKKAKRTRHS
jgi:hypothetical protein